MLWSSFNPRHSEAVGTIDGGGELPGIFFQGFLTNTLNPKVAHFLPGAASSVVVTQQRQRSHDALSAMVAEIGIATRDVAHPIVATYFAAAARTSDGVAP
jgi:threonine/homoserine/homoserine lactone efflux protein